MSIQRGDIYFVNLNPVQGREQAGQRPVLVLSIDAINRLPLVVTVVVGTKGANIPRDYPTNVRIASPESGCRSKPSFCAFKSAPSMQTVFRPRELANSAGKHWNRLKPPCATALGCKAVYLLLCKAPMEVHACPPTAS